MSQQALASKAPVLEPVVCEAESPLLGVESRSGAAQEYADSVKLARELKRH